MYLIIKKNAIDKKKMNYQILRFIAKRIEFKMSSWFSNRFKKHKYSTNGENHIKEFRI